MDVSTDDGAVKKILEQFRSLLKHDRLAHAYLLIGSRGSGTFTAACAIAAMVHCTGDGSKPCGRCGPCVKSASGNHPDVCVCDQGEEDTIKIHQIRDVIRRMQMRPYESEMNVVIIRNADVMTTEAANAFLKTLEEPSGRSLLILTASSADRLLDTVKSRCQMIYLSGMARGDLFGHLAQEGTPDQGEARLAAGFSDGCYQKASRLQREGFIAWKNEVVDRFLDGKADEKFLKQVLSDNVRTREALEALFFWFKDVLILKAQQGRDSITNMDRLADLNKWAARYSAEQVKNIISGIVNAKKMLDENLNIKIPFMVLRETIWINS